MADFPNGTQIINYITILRVKHTVRPLQLGSIFCKIYVGICTNRFIIVKMYQNGTQEIG